MCVDVLKWYNHVRIKSGDEWKAAFITEEGVFEPLVMFFGMSNFPATFQRFMEWIFRDLIRAGKMFVYIDDILI